MHGVRIRIRIGFLALVALLGADRTAFAQSVTSCSSAVSTRLRFVVKYEGGEWRSTAPDQKRITDRDRVEVCVEHFNFLRYTLKFDVAEQRAESYSYLTKLWSSILSPSFGGALGDPGVAVPTDLTEWLRMLYRSSRELDSAVAKATQPYTATGLTAAQAQTLASVRGDETATPRRGIVGQLDATRRIFQSLETFMLGNNTAFEEAYTTKREMFREITDYYRAVDERAALFVRLSGKTIGVEVKQVGKKQAGTRVTFTLTAVDESSAATPMDDVTYFVQTNMPLVAHGGISFSGLHDVTFEKVKRSATFGETELFQQHSDDNTTTGFTLFLGWQFFGSAGDVTTDQRQSRVGAAFSVGTDVTNPGKRVFAGPSLLLFSRLVLSTGLAFGKEVEGLDVTLEPDLFRIIRAKPAATWFFSLSTKVY